MERPFRPASLEVLSRWVFRELDARGTVLGLSPQSFQIPGPRLASTLFGRPLAAPLGVAAGPHTQLAQNIAAAWLCGARFIELKTVQVQDAVQVPRPCIDAAFETFNCEWSQELSLEQSFREYLNAHVLVHALAHRLGLPGPGALFAMSVGYDLAGIQSSKVQRFLAAMRGAGDALGEAVDAVAHAYPAVRDIEIPAAVSSHVTLSTMHGCPPEEIERIARHLREELGLHTWIKLNPTLLGPERLRGLLNGALGYDAEVPDEAFEHDLRLPDALAMVRRLAARAAPGPASFGLKLSNTLEVLNPGGALPASERTRYLSGRALHPLTLALAHELTEALDGQVPISFCGGADAFNVAPLVACGLSPVTACSDLLRPGGCARLQQYLQNLEAALDRDGAQSIAELAASGEGARARLAALAERAAREPRYARREGARRLKSRRALGLFDCAAAPCLEACPAGQNVPDYLRELARGRPREALAIVERANPLPAVTGEICERPCESACVRLLDDEPLAIRALKRHAAERGALAPSAAPGARLGKRAAVVGAGPAGLAAAEHLARRGFEVALFEARSEMGGMAKSAIPAFRLSPVALQRDLDRLRGLGIRLHLGAALGQAVALADLRRDHDVLFLGLGAQEGKKLGIPGDGSPGVLDALDLLRSARGDVALDLGARALVVGGGNTAMDAARAARRTMSGGSVELVYRRTRAQMPADPAEVQACLDEGIALHELLAPTRVFVEGGRAVGLACRPMALGPPDAAGRRAPVASGQPGDRPSRGRHHRRRRPATRGRPPRRARPTAELGRHALGRPAHGRNLGPRGLRGRRRRARPIVHRPGHRRRARGGRGHRSARGPVPRARAQAPKSRGPAFAPRSKSAARPGDPRRSGRLAALAGGRGARGEPLPRLRRALRSVRRRLPQPRDGRVCGVAASARAARLGAARRPARARRFVALRAPAIDPGAQRGRLLQRLRPLHAILPRRRRALSRQAPGPPRPRGLRARGERRLSFCAGQRLFAPRSAPFEEPPHPRGRRRPGRIPLGAGYGALRDSRVGAARRLPDRRARARRPRRSGRSRAPHRAARRRGGAPPFRATEVNTLRA